MTLLPPLLPPSLPTDRQSPHSGRDRMGMAIAWLIILATIASVSFNVHRSTQARLERAKRNDVADASRPENPQLLIVVKYAIGVKEVTGMSPPGLAAQLQETADSRADKLLIIPAIAELSGRDAALAELKKLDDTIPSTLPTSTQPATLPAPHNMSADMPLRDPLPHNLAELYLNGPASLKPADRQRVIDRLGWSGRLALTFGEPPEQPDRQALLRQANNVAAAMFSFVAGAFGAILIGFILFIIAIVYFANGNVILHYRRLLGASATSYPSDLPPRRTAPFVEAFAIYLGGQVGLSTIISAMVPDRSIVWTFIAIVPVGLALVWPWIRGVRGADFRIGFGWIAPRGFWREAGSGVLGYLAGLPVFLLGIVATFVLVRHFDAKPSHPIVQEAGGGGVLGTILLFVLAAVWAPLVEETFFRGALFHHLRSWCGWILSALISSVIFAAVHPQGWTLIPALASLAIVFCAIREWRGSTIGGMVAHALHNGALVAMLVFALN